MKITYRIHQLKVSNLNIKNYIYVIVDKESKKAAIVDPSWEQETVLNLLTKWELELSVILLTHSHYDHVHMVNGLLDKYPAKVYMSAIEADYYNFHCKNLIKIKDMDSIHLGDTEIRCIVTPGHTLGSTCYQLEDSLFTGDTVFIEGCGICNGKGGSASSMFDSIQRLKNIVSPDTNIYPAHSYGMSPGVPLKVLLKENIYFQLDERKYFVEFRTRKNQKHIFDFK